MKKLLTVAFLALVFPMVSLAKEKALTSSGSLGWEVTSKVDEVIVCLLRKSTDPSVHDFLKKVDFFAPKGSKQKIYKYTYVFSNKGEDRFKVNFSEWKLIHSPLTRVVQDFSFELMPNSSKTVMFLANSAPHEILSPVNIALWDSEKNKWVIIGAGKATFLIPEWGAQYIEVK